MVNTATDRPSIRGMSRRAEEPKSRLRRLPRAEAVTNIVEGGRRMRCAAEYAYSYVGGRKVWCLQYEYFVSIIWTMACMVDATSTYPYLVWAWSLLSRSPGFQLFANPLKRAIPGQGRHRISTDTSTLRGPAGCRDSHSVTRSRRQSQDWACCFCEYLAGLAPTPC